MAIKMDNHEITELELHASDGTTTTKQLTEELNLQQKTASANGEVTPDEGYDGLGKVIVAVSGDTPTYQEKIVTENGTVLPDEGYDALSKVTVIVEADLPELTDPATAADILEGKEAIDGNGAKLTGTCTYDADTSDANATASDIAQGKTAYVNGTKVTGTNTGGGGTPTPIPLIEEGVNFVDFDGTILETWTIEELATKTALPSNPDRSNHTHNGYSVPLTSQGWNFSLAEIKKRIEVEPWVPLFVGQMYIPTDGKTRVFFRFNQSDRTTPKIGIAVNGSATVDWNDGTEPDVIVGTGTKTVVYTPEHQCVADRDYMVTIEVIGSASIYGGGASSGNSHLLAGTGAQTYRSSITDVYVGSDITSIGDNGLEAMFLDTLILPHGITTFGTLAFTDTHVSKPFVIPDTLSSDRGIAVTTRWICYPEKQIEFYNSAFGNALEYYSLPTPDSGSSPNKGMCSGGSVKLASFRALNSGSGAVVYNNLKDCKVLGNPTSVSIKSSSITKLSMPESVTSISSCVLRAVTELVIPAGVTEINQYTMEYLYSLKKCYFRSATPPTIKTATRAFADYPADCVFYVPRGSLEAYQTAQYYPDPETYTYEEYDLPTEE